MLKRHLFNFEQSRDRETLNNYDAATLNSRQNGKRAMAWGFATAAALTLNLALNSPASAGGETPQSSNTPAVIVDDQPSGASGP
jgi:hypothetical protein